MCGGDQNYAARQSGLHQNPLSGKYSGVRCEHGPVSHPIQGMCRSVRLNDAQQTQQTFFFI